MLNIGIIGYGYWGPNILRNFISQKNIRIVAVADIDQKSIARLTDDYPFISNCRDYRELTDNKLIDVIAIVTPVFTHYEIAKRALENGKHVFVEKPFTSATNEAEELINIADKKHLIIMVDHTFIFTGAVKKIKELIDNKTLGRLYYYDSTRVNLGLFQHDINVIWDLAPHDFSIMDYVIDAKPVAVSATGVDHFGRGLEDISFITIYFNDNFVSHFNVNWLSPVKIRMTLVGGEQKMLVWNDLETDEKIKVYDKGVKLEDTDKNGIYKQLISYRYGDMFAPKIEAVEALRQEIKYFLNCLDTNNKPINDGASGYRVVKLLEASNKSLKENGRILTL